MSDTSYAGFWIRLWATLIDSVVMLVVLYIPLRFIYGEEYGLGDQLIYGFWDVFLGYVVPVCATVWFWRKYLATPGKLVTKLKVVDASTGETMSTGQAIGRYFAYFISILPLCLGFFWIAIDDKKQGWHDKLAGTVVFRGS